MFSIKKRNSIITLLLTTLVAFFPTALPAQASVTNLQLVINPYSGGLAISAPVSGFFSPIATPETLTVVSLTLETVTVTDTRRALSGLGFWTTNAQATNLLSITDTLTADTFGYVSGPNIKIGGAAFVTAQTRTSLDTALMVENAVSVTGNHTVSWFPTLTVPIAALKNPGTYSGSITHSVA